MWKSHAVIVLRLPYQKCSGYILIKRRSSSVQYRFYVHDYVMFKIRPITADDKEEWFQLWYGEDSYLELYHALSVVTPEITKTTFGRFLDVNEPVYAAVAVDDTGRLIGFATYLTHRDTWSIEDSLFLNDFFVSNECRRGGIGGSLIDFVYLEADRLGVKKVYWNTQLDNHRAQMFTKFENKSGFLLYVRP
ncbi:acyl-CoA N-acyltransferase [Metschnikowia bicuspidata var. bicuspidata NRRL YB-4993]|uniref:Acyl-CoA N-acyltransferase n=1 Tax=Metschnikowia bicuspidata var. bicuspidata NRRL YB-4993 TaxID=869754 RepID=A0A1A0HED8_9ASCO|nr:acyl-CoA N-acyltransferase [Metschnikowia bicuspidata var. bicuspidata NRRL YB-4993]OBA22268.1 acyl-CoA N-acyltransferase [Metschnikowia bicuspidata var. bicuspidata NRRL YB-4993]